MVALVLLPGMDGTGDLFENFIDALGHGVRPIIISYPAALALNYDELEQFARDRLPIDEQYVLLGESFSGPVAISIAASNPPGLAGLVLCCTFARNPHTYFRPLRRLVNWLPVTSTLSDLISPFLFGRFSSVSLRSSLCRVLGQVPASTLRVRLKAVLNVDCSREMSAIRVPTLYLQASDDRVVPASALKHISALRPDTRSAAIKGPHLLLQAVPVLAAKEVMTFVRSCSQ